MESLNCMGLMAVVAVSSSVALVAIQAHKRLLSDFMDKVNLQLDCKEFHGEKRETGKKKKKKVRFAADVMEPSSNNEEYRRRRWSTTAREVISTH